MTGDAAQLAQRLRDERAAIVAGIAGGTVDIASLDGDTRAAPIKAVVLAQAVPGVGKVRSRRVLETLGVADSTRWGDLGTDTTTRLVAGLRAAAEGTTTADGA